MSEQAQASPQQQACNSGTCIFHGDNQIKLNTLWDWHLTRGVIIEALVKKIDRTNALLGTIAVGIAIDIGIRLVNIGN